jgi:hypothetical protein
MPSSDDDSEFEDGVHIGATRQGHPTELTRKDRSEDGSDNDSESGRGSIIISKKKNNGNGDSSDDDAGASTSTSFG